MWLNPTTDWQAPSTHPDTPLPWHEGVIPSLRHLNWSLKYAINFSRGLLQEGIMRVTAGGLAGDEVVQVIVVFPGVLHVVGGDWHISQG